MRLEDLLKEIDNLKNKRKQLFTDEIRLSPKYKKCNLSSSAGGLTEQEQNLVDLCSSFDHEICKLGIIGDSYCQTHGEDVQKAIDEINNILLQIEASINQINWN